nr:hypothetical protein [Cyanobacteria bacterium RUI128]
RLLTLTARMHDIELRSQRIQAEKLRLANESDKVYANYLQALDAKKLQYKAIKSDGSIEFRDADLKIMENRIVSDYTGETAYETLFLQDPSGKIVVTPEVARKYELTASGNETRDMNTYIEQVTGKRQKERPVMGTHDVTDPNVVADFVTVDNTNTNPIPNPVCAPVENGEVTASNAYNYRTFQQTITEQNGTVELTTSNVSSVTANSGITYYIDSVQDLQAFATLSGAQTEGNTFVLSRDLNMSSIANWVGISGFAGTFNGNGHVLTGLKSNTNGLFISATETAVVKNVGLEGVNINNPNNSTSHDAGADIGGIVGSNQGLVTNCYLVGDVKTKGAHIGGICGEGKGTVSYCSADVNVQGGKQCVGGILGCLMGVVDHCLVTGTVTQETSSMSSGDYGWMTYYCGGLVGHVYPREDGLPSYISECHTSVALNATGNAGIVLGEQEANITISNTTYDPNITANTGLSVIGQVKAGTSSISTFEELDFIRVTPPSINPSDFTGGFYSNILGALSKYGYTDGTTSGTYVNGTKEITEAKVKKYIQNLMSSTDGDYKIANVNYLLYNYMNETTPSSTSLAFMSALETDIINQSTSNTSASTYQSQYDASNSQVTLNTTDMADAWDFHGTVTPGVVTCPTKANIEKELYYALKKAGKTISEEDVHDFMNKYDIDNSLEDQWYLANLNHQICLGTDIENIYTKVLSRQQYQNESLYDADGNYEYSFTNSTSITYTPGTSPEEYQVGTEKYWDTTDPDIAEAMIMWKLAQRGVIIATEDQATSKDYLINMLQAGSVLTTFDPTKVDALKGLTEQQIKDMDDYEYNKLVGIENTSVAVETSLREVDDEINLKKAEAQYEADMRKIDRKDAKYDAELAACENERNAIKTEMDTLKNVIKDNVDKTFKLFS